MYSISFHSYKTIITGNIFKHFNVTQYKQNLVISYGGGGLVAKSYLTLASPWTVVHQAPLSMGFLW